MTETTTTPVLSDLELLTRARALLDRDCSLIKGSWRGYSMSLYPSDGQKADQHCLVGAGLDAVSEWQRERRSWPANSVELAVERLSAEKRTVALLQPHLDWGLIDEAIAHPERLEFYEQRRFRAIFDHPTRRTPVELVTGYSDYVLFPRVDGKAQAMAVYDRAIAALGAQVADDVVS